MHKFSLVILLISCLYMGSKAANKECIKVEPIDVDTAFLNVDKFYLVEHSDCLNCDNPDEAYSWIKPRTVPFRICWDVEGTKNGKSFTIPLDCEYMQAGDGHCTVDATDLKLQARTTITHTDNKSYYAGAICIYGKENFWYIASINEKLDEKVLKEIESDLQKEGFDVSKKSTNASAVHFNLLIPKKC